MLQIIFGDDEHTASDGPYSRLMKTRKWLYLSTGALILVQFGLYDANATKNVIKIVNLPTPFIKHSLIFGVAYLLLQYCLLIGQLISTYDIVLSERFKFRRADDLAAATQRVKDQYAALQDAKREASADKTVALERFQSAAKELNSSTYAAYKEAKAIRLGAENSGSSANSERYAEHRARAAYVLARSQLKKAESNDAEQYLKLSDDPQVESATNLLLESQTELDHLRREVPSSRRGYATIERLIDTSRLLTPAIAAAVVLIGDLSSGT